MSTPTPQQIHALLESRLAEAQAKVDKTAAKLKTIETALVRAQTDHTALQGTYKDRLEQFNNYLDENRGAKNHAIVAGAVVAGLAAGWFLQKKYDFRVPLLALAGVGMFTAGFFTNRWSDTARHSLMYGGLAMAGTSVLFVVQYPLPDCKPPTA
ncbi:MAG: hypothetical protein ACPG4T_09965 [Nannocystaceae bacterium]